MARTPHIKASTDKIVVFRAADPELSQLLDILFSRYPEEESVCFLRCGWRVTTDSLVITLAALDPAREGDIDLSQPNVVINEPYSLRVALQAEKHPLAVGLFHSHPRDYRPRPSALDDDMDSYYAAEYFNSFAPSRPFVSMIVSSYAEELAISGRVYWQGKWFAVSRAILERKPSRTWIGGNTPAADPASPPSLARLASTFGKRAAGRLSRSTVAVIGAGGTGSAAIEVLARAGVARLVIVDPDTFAESNLERVHGSKLADTETRRPKVLIARDHVRSITHDCEVVALQGRMPQEAVLDAILDSDVLLGCTDQEHSRLAISDAAFRYLIPTIDCGVMLEGQEGNVTGQVAQIVRLCAADACVLCRGMIIQQRLNQELMSPEERERRQKQAQDAVARGEKPDPYWLNEPQINTVGYHTTAIGALVAGYAIGWITGAFDPPFTRLQMNLVAPFLDVTDTDQRMEPPRENCSCRRARGLADQGKRYALLTPPSHWEDVQELSSPGL